MHDMFELSEGFVDLVKAGLKSQGWLDAEEIAELKLKYDEQLQKQEDKIDSLNTKVDQLLKIINDTRQTLTDSYQSQVGSLSARGTSKIVADIETELEKVL